MKTLGENFLCHLRSVMTVGTTNSEEMCQIAVSQAMKHMRPDQESELLSVEETFPTEATQGEVPAPGIISVITSRIPCNEEKREQAVSKGLRTTINTPDAINNDKLRYLYPHNDSEASGSQHTPGQCACADCVSQQGISQFADSSLFRGTNAMGPDGCSAATHFGYCRGNRGSRGSPAKGRGTKAHDGNPL